MHISECGVIVIPRHTVPSYITNFLFLLGVMEKRICLLLSCDEQQGHSGLCYNVLVYSKENYRGHTGSVVCLLSEMYWLNPAII